MELDAEVLLNLEQDQAMQEDVAAEGLSNYVIKCYVIECYVMKYHVIVFIKRTLMIM